MRARVLEWTHSHIWVSRAERFLNGRDLFRSCNLTVVQTAGHSNFPVGQFVRRATTVKTAKKASQLPTSKIILISFLRVLCNNTDIL